MDLKQSIRLHLTRRRLFGLASQGIGVAALASLLGPTRLLATALPADATKTGGLPGLPHFAPKAKRVICLFQYGGPSQFETFDYKPKLKGLHGTQLPASVRQGPPLAGAVDPKSSEDYKVTAPFVKFQQAGQSGAWISELMPHTAKIVDDIAIIRSLHTEAVAHEPANTYFQTGFLVPGRPSMGAWVTYGLGSENENLPAFIEMVSKAYSDAANNLTARYWTAAFMPSKYQGVLFRAAADPVAYLSNPPGVSAPIQRGILDDLSKLNRGSYEAYGDPEIETRIAQYEMAFRMQASVPELTDVSKEPDSVFELYGPEARKPGTYAAQCLMARRLVERGVRFIQLHHKGWDHHGDLPVGIKLECQGVDQPSAALVQDLKQRGLLEDTLVIWIGEFGRTVYSQGALTADNYGRDHHGQCFTAWMAGGGIKPGITYGETDDFSFNVAKDPVSVHDLQATILHCLGIEHTRLTYKFQGRYFRLTDTSGEVVKGVLI